MKRFDARKKVLECLKAKGLFRGVTDNPMVVPICNRSTDIIEPIIKAQWYVKSAEMGKRALNAVDDGELKQVLSFLQLRCLFPIISCRLIPDFYRDTWRRWLEDIRDWCIRFGTKNF
jgi:valyl-tRNA synthetase